MLKGLKEVDASLQAKHIPFYLLQGQAASTVPALAAELDACAVVTDFSPLREPLAAAQAVGAALDGTWPVLQVRCGVSLVVVGVGCVIYVYGPGGGAFPQFIDRPIPPMHTQNQVDAHNVVPVWEASPKQEVGARTLRKRIHDRFPEYFVRCGLFTFSMRCLILCVSIDSGVCSVRQAPKPAWCLTPMHPHPHPQPNHQPTASPRRAWLATTPARPGRCSLSARPPTTGTGP